MAGILSGRLKESINLRVRSTVPDDDFFKESVPSCVRLHLHSEDLEVKWIIV